MKVRYLIIAAFLLLTSCSDHISDKPVSLTFADNNKTVKVYVSQSIDVNLIEDASEGKVWGINPYDTRYIGFTSSKFRPDEKIKGAGGHRIIRFRALRAGKSELEIDYYHTTREEVKKIKVFKVMIDVVNDDRQKHYYPTQQQPNHQTSLETQSRLGGTLKTRIFFNRE